MIVEKKEDLIIIGKIVNTQGHLGEVRAIPLTDFPDRFSKMETVTVELGGKKEILHIEKARSHNQFIVLKFREILDMNGAEALKGAELKVPREELIELPEDSYYIFDLIGLTVVEVSGREIGKLKDVLTTGSNDVYVVERAENKDLLVPALKTVVIEIDIPGGRMVVDLPPGLEEL